MTAHAHLDAVEVGQGPASLRAVLTSATFWEQIMDKRGIDSSEVRHHLDELVATLDSVRDRYRQEFTLRDTADLIEQLEVGLHALISEARDYEAMISVLRGRLAS